MNKPELMFFSNDVFEAIIDELKTVIRDLNDGEVNTALALYQLHRTKEDWNNIYWYINATINSMQCSVRALEKLKKSDIIDDAIILNDDLAK